MIQSIRATLCGAVLFGAPVAYAADSAISPMALPSSGTYQYRGDAIVTKIVNNAGSGNPNACTYINWGIGDTAKIRILPVDNANITVNGSTLRVTMLGAWSAVNFWIPNFASYTVPSMTEIVIPATQQLIVGKGYSNFAVNSGITINKMTPAPSAIATTTNYIYAEFKFRNFYNAATTGEAGTGIGNNGCDVTFRASMVLVP